MPEEDRVKRAKHAERLLADPVMVAAQRIVISEATRDWVNTSQDELAQREEAYMRMKGLTALLDVLNRFVQDGVNLTRETKDGT